MKKNWILLVIIFFAGFLRITGIDHNPPSISWDEASIGYNAYSVLKTARDEHGTFLPLDTFAAFGDYKPPVPIYLTVPFIALFGLSESAVRFPSAIFGVLAVLVLYGLVLELFHQHKHATWIAFVSSGVLAFTPWHIMLSRAGFEANIAFLFLITGAWLVLFARRNPKWFYVCWLPFVLGVYTFNSARYAGPLLALGMLIFIRRAIWQARRPFVTGVVIAGLALLPIIPHLLSEQSRLRFNEVSIFTDLNVVLSANARIAHDGNTLWANIFDNRRLGYLHSYLVHFFDNIQPRFLFIRGDGNPKFSIQDTGELLLVTAPFIAYGILRLFSELPGIAWLMVWWLVVSIAPAAVARETPHALRVENGLPFYMIMTAYGLVSSIVHFKKKYILLTFYFLLFTFNFIFFWHNLTTHYPAEYSGEWQYGYKQAIQYADSIQHKYDTIVLSDSIGRPYIYVLFYTAVDPNIFWKTKDASFDAAGFYNVYGFGKYRFVSDNLGSRSGRVLYILDPSRVPKSAHILKTIRVLNGTPILVVFD